MLQIITKWFRSIMSTIGDHMCGIGVSAVRGRKYVCRVSSTLNRDTKQFGKKHLFDDREDTCWNSDQGSPQWVSLEFDGETKILDFYPEDGNKNQFFYLKEVIRVKKIRFAFNSSTDFYGRITIYNLDVFS